MIPKDISKSILSARLEAGLKKYDRIFLIVDDENVGTGLGMLTQFYNWAVLQNLTGKILVLWHFEDAVFTNVDYRQITKEELQTLKQLYCMYEFSDRFQVISWESQYGSLFNLVDTGILTMEEAFQALLHGTGGQTG